MSSLNPGHDYPRSRVKASEMAILYRIGLPQSDHFDRLTVLIDGEEPVMTLTGCLMLPV